MGTSTALDDWKSSRSDSIDRLFAAHRKATGGKPGRQWLTQELVHALIARLASEFQGFCRDLHDEAIDFLVSNGGVTNPTISGILRVQLISGRNLNHGNAVPEKVGADFARLGMTLWDDVEALLGQAEKKRRYDSLTHLIWARNAIVHDDQAKLAGWDKTFEPLTLEGARKWRTTEKKLATAFDQVVGSYLTKATGSAPW